MNRFGSDYCQTAFESISEKVKLESQTKLNLCRCCLADDDLKCMITTYYVDGKSEIYAEMAMSCFCIEFITPGVECQENVYMICSNCISRLREAYSFKNQIEAAQESMNKYNPAKNQKDEIKNEEKSNRLDLIIEVSLGDDTFMNDSDSDHHNSSALKNQPALLKKQKNNSNKQCNVKLKRKALSHDLNNTDNFDSAENTFSKNESVEKTFTKRIKSDQEPYKLDKDQLTCKICNETFPLHSTLVRHMPIHYPNHICHVCARVFATKSKLKSHVIRHRQNQETCTVCNKTYKGTDNLKKHMRYHFGPDVIYKCPQCPERFSVYYKRMKHLVEVHNDEAKKYKCKQCPKRYYQACTLSRHIKNVHLQERNCICSECGNAFYDKSGLNEHMLKHTGIKKFQCEICFKSYGRRFTLNEHMKIHTNEKRFVCPVCGRRFTQKCTLKSHMLTHEKSQSVAQPKIEN